MISRILVTVFLVMLVAGCSPEAAARWEPFCQEIQAGGPLGAEQAEAWQPFCNMIAASAVLAPPVEPAEWDQNTMPVDDDVDDAVTPLPDEVEDTPEPCLIKLNIGKHGQRIYHMPGGAYYDQVQINPTRGEAYACSEEQAQEMGWRKSQR